MNTPYTPPKSNYISVVSTRTGRTLFRIDLARGIIELQDRGVKECVDLAAIANGHGGSTNPTGSKQAATAGVDSAL